MHLTQFLTLVALSTHAPQDWPQFGGPERSGVVTESEWTPVGVKEPLWRANVGLGYSCPSIVGSRLVTMGYDAEAELDHVLCLDAETGVELWDHSYEATDDPSYHGGGTLTTPTIVGGIVYTVNRLGRAFALELETGETLWERDYRSELDLQTTFHGFCASPVIVGDRIIYVFGGVAVSAERGGGDVQWRTEDHGDGAYTNPTVLELRGRTLVAVMLGQILFVLDLANGEVVHRLDWPLRGNSVHVAQPLAIGERLLISTAYGKGAGMLRLGDEVEPEVLWTSRRLRNKVTGLYLHDGHVFGFDESMLKCFDLEGDEKWRVRGLGMGALSIAGGRLLILSSGGELIVAEATPEEFRELSRREALDGGSYWSMPVLSGGRIYIRNSLGDLACLDHRTASDAGVAEVELGPAPSAVDLFAAHSRAVGGEEIRRAPGLRLDGDWEILGRGMTRTPSTLVLGPPNRWRLGLNSGQLVHTFDGDRGWEHKNGGLRLFDEAEAKDAPRIMALSALFAPDCPDVARTSPAPVTFAGSSCWRVDSTLQSDGGKGEKPRAMRHYFEVATGRLVGREGDDSSTMVFKGAIEVDNARIPEVVVIYRTGSGQEESFYVSSGEWVAPDDDAFERPAGLQRLLRTPEQRAKDTIELRERYAKELGVYRPHEEDGPDEDLSIAVDDGDLFALAGADRSLLLPDAEDHEALRLVDFGGATWRFQYDGGKVTGGLLEIGSESIEFTRLE